MFPPITKYRVVGESMEPTFREGDTVIVFRHAYLIIKPKKGHIVLLFHPKKHIPLIKRITNVTKEKIFVRGDNAKKSSDSRHFGWAEKKDILGKVLYAFP